MILTIAEQAEPHIRTPAMEYAEALCEVTSTKQVVILYIIQINDVMILVLKELTVEELA